MNKIFFLMLILFVVVQVTAESMIPTFHQLYGEVRNDGELVMKKTSVAVYVNNTVYITFTDKGRYGYDSIFFIENGNPDETMYIYVNGRWVDTLIFKDESTTKLDIDINESQDYMNNKESAIAYMRAYRKNREININLSFDTLTYISNKICEIDYYDEMDSCRACFMFNYTIEGDVYMTENCMSFYSKTTLEEDDDRIKKYIREYIDVKYDIEEIRYVERNIIGRII